MDSNKKPKLNIAFFWSAVGLMGAITVLFITLPGSSVKTLDRISDFCIGPMGSFYLWGMLAALLLVLWLSFSRVGDIRLGGADEEPEYPFGKWLVMIFTSATGCGALYWSMVEWAYFYKDSPPWGATPGSWQAGEWASTYTLLHNGPLDWSIMALTGVAVAYQLHVRKIPYLRFSETCRPILKRYTGGFIGNAIDFCVVFGKAAGIATTMAFAGPMVSGAICAFLGVDYSEGYSYLILAGWLLVGSAILLVNLNRGFAKVSYLIIFVLLFFLLYVFVCGPTRFIVEEFTTSIGKLCTNFFSMALWTDAIGKSNFPQDWTIYFQSGYVIFAPVVSLFFAKISRGRSIRQMALGITFGGTFGAYTLYGILGNFSMWVDISGKYALSDVVKQGLPASQVVGNLLMYLPLHQFIMLIFICMSFIYALTTITSTAYSFAATTSHLTAEASEPAEWNRLFWMILMMVVSGALMSLGGLSPLKAVSNIIALPMLFICAMSAAGLLIRLREDGFLKREQIFVKSRYVYSCDDHDATRE